MFHNDWQTILGAEQEKIYFKKLMQFIQEEYKNKTIYPKTEDIFNAFEYTPYSKVKVVILGQDPYHGANQAEGLSFSVKAGTKKPPSLVNILKELTMDLGYRTPLSGSLVSWAKEGVLLLNTVLTVEQGSPASHKDKGWEQFTDKVISLLNDKKTPVVFILWGNFAINKKSLITNKNHYILSSCHPSPFSAYRGFFGSKPFSKTNKFLVENHIDPINWELK